MDALFPLPSLSVSPYIPIMFANASRSSYQNQQVQQQQQHGLVLSDENVIRESNANPAQSFNVPSHKDIQQGSGCIISRCIINNNNNTNTESETKSGISNHDDCDYQFNHHPNGKMHDEKITNSNNNNNSNSKLLHIVSEPKNAMTHAKQGRYVRDIISTIGESIDRMLVAQDSSKISSSSTDAPSDFQCKSTPQLALKDYISRLVNLMNYWEMKQYPRVKTSEIPTGVRSLIISLIYLDRLSSSNQYFTITRKSIYKMVLVAMVLAVKFVEDRDVSMRFMARVGGIPVDELIKLERLFLDAIEFRLFVSDLQFRAVYDKYISLSQRVIQHNHST